MSTPSTSSNTFIAHTLIFLWLGTPGIGDYFDAEQIPTGAYVDNNALPVRFGPQVTGMQAISMPPGHHSDSESFSRPTD